MRPWIDQDLSVVFYDLTTVEVTGQTALPDDVRAYGRAKSGLVAARVKVLVAYFMRPMAAYPVQLNVR